MTNECRPCALRALPPSAPIDGHRRWRTVAVAATMAALWHPIPLAAQHVVETARDGVVRVIVLANDPRDRNASSLGSGSGFIVNAAGAIVTNHHVIADAVKYGGTVKILFDGPAQQLAPELERSIPANTQNMSIAVLQQIFSKLPSAKVQWLDEKKDLAVLIVEGQTLGTPLALAPSDLVRQGDRVHALGYPGINDAMGAAAYVTLTQNEGEISSKQYYNQAGVGVYQISANVRHGMSGGPLVNPCGQVIGVDGWGRARGAGLDVDTAQYSIQIDAIMPVLDAQRLAYDRVAARCSPGAAAVRDPLVVGGIALSIGLGAVAVVLASTKRGRKAVRNVKDEVSRRVHSSFRPVPRAARPAPPLSPLAPPRPVAAPLAPALRGISGEFAGNTVPLGEEPLTIGRDPRVNQLVFPPTASGVSNRHCVVRYDRALGAVVIEDLGSTNGTYLASGLELRPGEPRALKAMDRFYLGDPVNLFEVRFEARS